MLFALSGVRVRTGKFFFSHPSEIYGLRVATFEVSETGCFVSASAVCGDLLFEQECGERETDLYWWFEAMWQARLTQHDRFIVWQFQNAKQTRLLLTIGERDL